MMALYPITKTEEIAEEFGISVPKLRRMARICRVKKSEGFRREIGKLNGRKSVERFIKQKIRREQRTVKLWNDGLSMSEIAKRLHVTKRTVYAYLLHAKKKGALRQSNVLKTE